MSMRKDQGRSRALRPSAEGLEVRQLLSATVTGTDTAGDKWTLTLLGKGALQVLKQNDPSTSLPGTLTSATEINSITISGTDPRSTRLIGTVVPASGSDGRVFFNTLNEIPNHSDIEANGLGILAINMPDFYLGYTGTTKFANASSAAIAEINIPDGVNSLRFGGVDTTKFFGTDPTLSPAQDNQNDQFLVKLGLPEQIGTSIVVDQVESNAEAGVASSSGTAGSPTQKSVVFQVAGRINLFEANQISGNSSFAPAQGAFNGGTIVASFGDPTSAITGAIGFVRVGGNATNFSVVTNNIMSNLYIGGETSDVSVLTPNGLRNAYFGKGFDTTTILTHSLENLYANRDALNSTLTSERKIGNLSIGGNVANTTVLSGYQDGLAALASSVQSDIAGLAGTAATPGTPVAQANGQITALIAGNVTNSVFAASVLPISQVQNSTDQTFGASQDALLPQGNIIARVEGVIDNSTATPDSPTKAFFAQHVSLTHAVVVPPNVIEPPLPPPTTPVTLPGIPHVFPASTSTNFSTTKVTTITTGSGSGSSGAPVGILSTKVIPKGATTTTKATVTTKATTTTKA